MDYVRQLLRESRFESLDVETRAYLLYSALLGYALLPHNHGRFSRKRVLRETVHLLAANPDA